MADFRFLHFHAGWVRLACVSGIIALYLMLFFPAYAARGSSAAALSTLPVVAISWFFGLRAGFIAALLAFPVNSLLLNLAGEPGFNTIIQQGGPGSAVLVLVSVIVGRLSDLGKKLEHELTKRQRAEEALRESETKFRLIVETALDAVISMDADGLITTWNPQAEVIFGWLRSEALGHPLAHMIIPPQHREAHRRGLAHFLKTGEAALLNNRFEITALHRKGFEFPVELTITPLQIGGRFIFNAFLRDITERKTAQEKLLSSQKRLQLMIEQTPAVLWTTDMELRLTSSLGAGLEALGLKPNQTVGMTLFDYFQTSDQDFPPITAHDKALKGESVNYEYTWQDCVYQSYLEPLLDTEGNIIGCIGISFDITSHKEAEAQRLQLALEKEKSRLLGELISDLSHDLKTPLSIINTGLYLLEKLTDPEKQRNKIEAIQTQVTRLDKIIEDILTSAKLDRIHELTFKSLDFNRLIQAIERDFTPKAEVKNITLIADQCSEDLIILANEISIQRALVNLVENALNYTPDGGRIVIRSHVQGKSVVIEVQDTGIGIDAADLPHIFDRFYRADQARNTRTGGTGLGLAITRKIVELHGGIIEVESERGKGTIFRMLLPLKPEQPSLS